MKAILEAAADAAPVAIFSILCALFGYAGQLDYGQMNTWSATFYAVAAVLAACAVVFFVIAAVYYTREAREQF